MSTTVAFEDLKSLVGGSLGTSGWLEVDQARINTFADATGDHQWIHVDPEKAASGPFGQTVAHGYLSLSLIPALLEQVLRVKDARMGVNYGIEKVRFTAPVPSGSEVRLLATLNSTERRGEGVLFRLGVTIEIRGEEKPALVGEVLYLTF